MTTMERAEHALITALYYERLGDGASAQWWLDLAIELEHKYNCGVLS